jgi:hypothetical protein
MLASNLTPHYCKDKAAHWLAFPACFTSSPAHCAQHPQVTVQPPLLLTIELHLFDVEPILFIVQPTAYWPVSPAPNLAVTAYCTAPTVRCPTSHAHCTDITAHQPSLLPVHCFQCSLPPLLLAIQHPKLAVHNLSCSLYGCTCSTYNLSYSLPSSPLLCTVSSARLMGVNP